MIDYRPLITYAYNFIRAIVENDNGQLLAETAQDIVTAAAQYLSIAPHRKPHSASAKHPSADVSMHFAVVQSSFCTDAKLSLFSLEELPLGEGSLVVRIIWVSFPFRTLKTILLPIFGTTNRTRPLCFYLL